MVLLPAAPFVGGQQQNTAQPTGDGIADAARKAREEKKSSTALKKVLTEDDISTSARGKNTSAASTDEVTTEAARPRASSMAAEETAEDPGDKEKKKEAVWRSRFKQARIRLAAAEKQLDIMQRDLQKSQLQYYPDPQKALAEQNSRKDIDEKTAKIAAQKDVIAKLKQDWDDMEIELRKTGGDSGWARE